jgi:CxxC-x17-CxxC domain-containing protein
MGNFRSDNRDRGSNRNRSGGNSGGRFNRGSRDERYGEREGFRSRDSRSFGRDRDSGSFERRRPEMHEVICDKCKKKCEVPFKPTGDKPVLCSDCFKKDGGSNFGPRGSSVSSGISQEQYKELNKKLDKILEILESLEIDEDNDEDDEE